MKPWEGKHWINYMNEYGKKYTLQNGGESIREAVKAFKQDYEEQESLEMERIKEATGIDPDAETCHTETDSDLEQYHCETCPTCGTALGEDWE